MVLYSFIPTISNLVFKTIIGLIKVVDNRRLRQALQKFIVFAQTTFKIVGYVDIDSYLVLIYSKFSSPAKNNAY